jgi:hypothetical protein
MTVKELISILSQIEDQDLRVVIKGYEGGYGDLVFTDNTPLIFDIALNVNPEWWYGDHERVSPQHHQYGAEVEVIKAVLI